MRNYQRQLAITLITSITMTSIGSTRAWADIRLQDRSATQEVQVKRYETVMVPKRVEVTDVQSRQVKATDVVRDDSDLYVCKTNEFAGMDRQVLDEKIHELEMQHMKTVASEPLGSAAVGAVAGAALTIATGGVALVAAGIGAVVGGLFSWFRGGNTEEQRDLAARTKRATADAEVQRLRCMKNERDKSQIYAGTLPGRMPASVSSLNEPKATATVASNTSSSSSGSSSSGSSSSSSSGNANGTANQASHSCPYNGGCDNNAGLYDANDGRETYDGTQPPQVQEVQNSKDDSAKDNDSGSGSDSGSRNSIAECLM
jgi:hypothetical protein